MSFASYNQRQFFDGIEGLASLSPRNGFNGLYVATDPHVRLARVVECLAAPPLSPRQPAHAGA